MTPTLEKKMSQLLRKYEREGRSAARIASWKRGWYMVGRAGTR